MTCNKKPIKVLDLFAGAGGFGLGFRLASERYKLICSLEVDKWAVETLEANNKDNQIIIHDDIRQFDTTKRIMNACPSRPHIIIGGPPCQGFSVAGPVKDVKDPRNSLFKNFAQWVSVLTPKLFVMENVRGLLSRKNEEGEKVIEIIKNTFSSIGYAIDIWELNAANYGVPQNRSRIIIVGNKWGSTISVPCITHYLPDQKIKFRKILKKISPAIKVITAIGDLPKLRAGEGREQSEYTNEPRNDFQRYLRGDQNILYNHVCMWHLPRVVKRYEEILKGLSLDEISNELRVRKRNGNGQISSSSYHSNYRHLKPKMVSYTVPASFYSNFIHPSQPRNITSREAARLQSFPDSYIFKGKRTQVSSKLLIKQGKETENHLSQYNQIGNAVPPLLAKAIANRLLEFLDENDK